MSEKIKLTITPAVAAYVRPGTPPDVKLSGFSAARNMAVQDRLMLLFCLSKDADPSIKSTALTCLRELPPEIIREYRDSDTPHPMILEAVLPLFPNNDIEEAAEIHEISDTNTEADSEFISDLPETDTEAEEDAPVNEEDEEFLSKYKMAQLMGIGEKIKMALTGFKKDRTLNWCRLMS